MTWSRQLFGRLRLRHKLALSLSIAALLSVVAASWVAFSVVLRGLDRGLREDTERYLRVGMSLLVGDVDGLGNDAAALASSGDLRSAVARGPAAIEVHLLQAAPYLPASLVEITDAEGRVVARRVVGGGDARFAGLKVGRHDDAVKAALTKEAHVDIVRQSDKLLVRAAVPMLDHTRGCVGVVVFSVPLDEQFVDGIKSALGVDAMMFARSEQSISPAAATFVDASGGRLLPTAPSAAVVRAVVAGQPQLETKSVGPRDYVVGYASLQTRDGESIGLFAVAADRARLVDAKSGAIRSLALGAAGAFIFALGLAGLLSRRITQPIAKLHRGAVAISRGDMDQTIEVAEGDEIGDLAEAFSVMTQSLKENQGRLAARMRELVALHEASRAVSSVLDLETVLDKIVDSVARVFDAQVCAMWLVRDPSRVHSLELGAARAKREGRRQTIAGLQGAEQARSLSTVAVEAARTRSPVRIDDVSQDVVRRDAAISAGVTGSLLAMPLERMGVIVGVIVIGRAAQKHRFSEADASLLATFADQAAAAVENARLYGEVRAFSEELEAKVRRRTEELTLMNEELGRTIVELRDTQAQLVLSERMAGLGLLVAGVAHEINSPSAAIRGSVDALSVAISRLTQLSHDVAALGMAPDVAARFAEVVATACPELAERTMPPPAQVRRNSRALAERIATAVTSASVAQALASSIAEVGANDEDLQLLWPFLSGGNGREGDRHAQVLVSYLTETVYLLRSSTTIRRAIERIQRLVGSLKSYSHLDQQASLVEADIHAGIDNTLAILHYLLRAIRVTRKYGNIPRLPVYIDELNQVWTNLIQNAVQALDGGGNIVVESFVRDQGVSVCVTDDGPGIPADVLPSIFDQFFTTKKKGEGTGLGLGIARQIVAKHGGTLSCDSEPGRTCFEVWLPFSPPGWQVVSDEPAGAVVVHTVES